MRKLIITNQFKKAYKHYTLSYPNLINRIEDTLLKMEEDVFQQFLYTHKLFGKLYGLRACSCGYDCRIVFKIEINSITKEEEIVLLNIGNHEIVY
ncbi:MAG: type II toxin-antitoxin system mRNA interferase toxin, RelE/StbE family [FCB group bacterium]